MARKKKTGKSTTRKKTTAKATTSTKAKAGRAGERPFPRASLSEAIRIALALKEYNGGNSWPSSELKDVVDKSIGNKTVQSNHFYYLTAASRDFGFTEGTTNAKEVSLTEAGRAFAYAGSKEDEVAALKDAFARIQVFSSVFDHYGALSNLPEKKYAANTLENQFKLDPSVHDEFLELFRENLRFAQLDQKSRKSIEGKPSGGADVGIPVVFETDESGFSVVAEPEGGSERTLFVAIPFGERTGEYAEGFFREVLSTLIGPAGAAAGFRVVTARRAGSDLIQSTIVNGVLDSDLVVIDLTEHNPNVLFELGLRIAEDKPIALVRAEGTTGIFDVDNLLRVFDYSPNLWTSTIEGDLPNLTAHIKASWDRRKSQRTYLKILRSTGATATA